jgi:hypothetical protein
MAIHASELEIQTATLLVSDLMTLMIIGSHRGPRLAYCMIDFEHGALDLGW